MTADETRGAGSSIPDGAVVLTAGAPATPRQWKTIDEIREELGDDPPAVFALQREMVDRYVVAHFTIEGEPESKARARWQATRGGRPYTPNTTRVAQERIGTIFRQAVGPYQPNATDCFGVIAIFFCSTRQRRDVDNMLKLVMDGLNKVAWADDCQVTEVSARVVRNTENPRSAVLIYHTAKQTTPTTACAQCGKQFPVYPSQAKSRRFCERACGYAYRRAQNRRVCGQCGKDFQSTRQDVKFCSKTCGYAARNTSLQCVQCGKEFTRAQSVARRSSTPVCSIECRETYWRARSKARAQGTCADCDGPTSKRAYVRCNACRVAYQRSVIVDMGGEA